MSNDDSENKKAGPGWYVDKRWPKELRRWDGTKWLDDWRPEPGASPETLIYIGIALAMVAGMLVAVAFEMNDTAGWIALWVGAGIAGTVFNIGVIAKAVQIGVRSAGR